MTKLPPGRACFPQASVLRADPKTQGQNLKHGVRWLEVDRLRNLSEDTFKKETDLKKSWDNTFLSAAKIMHVDLETIRRSYKKVQRALREGNSSQFFVADWPPAPKSQGKKIT